MRISTRKGDAGYHPEAHLYRVKIDGKIVNHCFTADDELGEAHCYVPGKKGGYIPNKEMTGFIEQVVKGRIKIIKLGES